MALIVDQPDTTDKGTTMDFIQIVEVRTPTELRRSVTPRWPFTTSTSSTIGPTQGELDGS